jgi:hypothetical protein
MVKSLLTKNRISRIFIAGVSPLSLTDIGSGFNIARNISFDGDVAGLCGLTRADVEAALTKICASDREVKKHISTMTKHFNGYHFSDEQKVEPRSTPRLAFRIYR